MVPTKVEKQARTQTHIKLTPFLQSPVEGHMHSEHKHSLISHSNRNFCTSQLLANTLISVQRGTFHLSAVNPLHFLVTV